MRDSWKRQWCQTSLMFVGAENMPVGYGASQKRISLGTVSHCAKVSTQTVPNTLKFQFTLLRNSNIYLHLQSLTCHFKSRTRGPHSTMISSQLIEICHRCTFFSDRYFQIWWEDHSVILLLITYVDPYMVKSFQWFYTSHFCILIWS